MRMAAHLATSLSIMGCGFTARAEGPQSSPPWIAASPGEGSDPAAAARKQIVEDAVSELTKAQVAGEIRGLDGIAQAADPAARGLVVEAADARPVDPAPWRQALGGMDNIREGLLSSSRILLELEQADRVAVVQGSGETLHLILGPEAAKVAAGLSLA